MNFVKTEEPINEELFLFSLSRLSYKIKICVSGSTSREEIDFRPDLLLSPWYPRVCSRQFQSNKYCGISTVIQNRKCLFYRWNETGDGECFIDTTDDVTFARKLSCFYNDNYPFLQREILCDLDNFGNFILNFFSNFSENIFLSSFCFDT